MACEILITAVAKPGITERGYPWIVKNVPCEWGDKESPPNWVILRITDATKNQVKHYFQSWKKRFSFTILSETPDKWRIKVEVDPALISASGMNKEIRTEMKNYIVEYWGATIISHDAYSAIVDLPKFGGAVELQRVKDDILDLWGERIDSRFYYFTGIDVDLALANGGFIELTKQQVLNRIKSKLDE